MAAIFRQSAAMFLVFQMSIRKQNVFLYVLNYESVEVLWTLQNHASLVRFVFFCHKRI